MWFALLLACSSEPPDTGTAAATRLCNGRAELCDRPVDEVAFAVTHNAYNTAEDEYFGPNQTHGLTRQLDDGVRGMLLDLRYDGDVVSLCHGDCVFGSRPLADGLVEIRDFLEAHPNEVVLLVLERHTDPFETAQVFEELGLVDRAYTHVTGEPWPTLGALADDGRTLLVFDEDEVPEVPWVMHMYTEGWDTDYAAQSPEDFSCDPLRGDPSNDLFLMNHFLTQMTGSPDLAEQVNHDPLLGDRAEQCMAEAGQFLNLIAVDFYEIGDVLTVIDRLNGVE